MRKLALFDLDNTLNTTCYRKKLVPHHDIRNNAEWLPWHKAFHSEPLNLRLITTAAAYKDAGFEIAIVSNRDNSLIEETRVKLANAGWPMDCRYHLSSIDDHRHPSQWKLETIQNLLDYAEPIEVHVFDDDKSVLMKLGERFRFNRDVQFIPHNIQFE
ncbi:hypothetical protein CB1_49 [Pectobacterium phage vB_PatP_CB1]|uniref:Nucleotidase n=1 Tax=Pectobacterium phage vB_PatP_CB1 TaxID=1958917 RepID=A0A2P0PAN8_9CAUD|nr:hypothetical protein HWB08_gp49 [Pectobacterium phage vB_PatP_CB1]ARB11776.1 hypothetical protein CB1_49 [Pectobacterium phage vB_PatP_CB1]